MGQAGPFVVPKNKGHGDIVEPAKNPAGKTGEAKEHR